MRKSTPWGQADNATVLAEGIISYSTPSHGGIWLSAARRAAIAHLGAHTYAAGDLEWWEEDCDWAVPYFFFRDDIRAAGNDDANFKRNVDAAQETIRGYHKGIANMLLTSPAEKQRELADMCQRSALTEHLMGD